MKIVGYNVIANISVIMLICAALGAQFYPEYLTLATVFAALAGMISTVNYFVRYNKMRVPLAARSLADSLSVHYVTSPIEFDAHLSLWKSHQSARMVIQLQQLEAWDRLIESATDIATATTATSNSLANGTSQLLWSELHKQSFKKTSSPEDVLDLYIRGCLGEAFRMPTYERAQKTKGRSWATTSANLSSTLGPPRTWQAVAA